MEDESDKQVTIRLSDSLARELFRVLNRVDPDDLDHEASASVESAMEQINDQVEGL